MTSEMSSKRPSLKRKYSELAQPPAFVEDEEEEDEINDLEDGGTFVDGIYIPPATKPVLSFDPTGPRLIITKIENNFFKSYARLQVLGPFHKCFNAIVGPNGSGKSNVIDSMLFVFGYRATKIRSKKLSVLLHNSEGEQNVNSCTVSVHFALIIDRDGDGYDVVPNSEFYVSRVANKDNSSHYMLNGKKVPFKEVGNLLKSHGIDLTYNRFLILQGEVEQIAMMKCKAESEHEPGMLEYLEDVIGTTRYKKPIMLVNERVESLAEHRNEKLNRLKMVEAEVEVLKAPMEEAVGFLKTENNIILSQNIIYQTKIIQSEKDLKVCKADVEHVHEVEGDLVRKLESLETEKEEKQKILKEETTKHEGFQTKLDWLNEAFNKANSKDIQLQESMTQMNATRKKTKQLAAEERIHLEKLEQQPEKDLQALKECEKKEESLSVQKTKLVEEKAEVMAKMRDETKELQAQKEELQTDLIDLQKAVDETKSAFTLADSALKIYISNEEAEREKLEKLQERVATTKPAIIEKTALVATLKKKIPATENSLKQATAELNEVRKREDQLLSETKKKSAYLQETRSSMQANKSRGRVLESLMQLKREGKCDGLFGRLGDLGAIDQKYDVAISTACGPLDNIVVDNVTTAQSCIEFLKHHDIGRATFIALDKQDRYIQEANSKIRTPENVHRLFDLIQVEDDRIRPAFYYAIRDTLVANDLEQASRIAYGAQRFRVVTLKGDLIETTGTMSGGGKSVSRGRMGQTVQVTQVDPQELENIELVIQQNEVTLREYRQKQASLQDQIRTLEPELRKMKIDLERLGLELQSLKQQEPLLLEQLKKQEVLAKNTKANPVEVKKLKAVVDAKREEYEQAKATADELQKEVDKFSKQIHEKTTGKIQVIDKKIKEVTKSLDKMKSEIVRLKVSGKTIERNVKKSEEKIQTMDQDVENMGNRLRQMKEERTLIEDDAKKLLACIEDINENIEAAQGAYTEVKEEVAAIIKKENKIRSEKVDVDAKVKALEKRLTEYNSILLQWEAKLNQLKLQEVPNETTEPLKKYTAQELDEMDLEHVQKVMDAAKNEIKVAKPNLQAIQEYQKKQAVYVQRSTELQEITLKRDEMRKLYDKLRFQRKSEFMTGFNIIKMKLKEMYQMITLEGDADFEMVDTFDPFTEGIQFNVRPPKKSWKQISNLSGGEKTLSSLALVFALHYYKPSPLYVMDEIDAALDFKNVSIVGRYIQERTKNAQFIIISLRSNMFELCDVAVGIFKTNNRTKSITINPKLYAAHHSEYRLKVTQTQTPETEDIIEPESDNLGTSDEPMEAAQEPVNSENIEKAAEASDLSSSISSLSECNENVADSVENMDVDS